MTPTDVLNYVRRLHTEDVAQTSYWSDQELYALMEAKSNEVLGIIGLIEAIDSTTLSAIGTSDYTLPSNFIYVRRIYYANRPLKYLNLRQFEARSPQGTAPSGTPREFFLWNNVATLVPTPSTAGDIIKVYGEKQQSAITSSSSTIDIPAVFHGALCDAIISEMFVKDLNTTLAQFYQNKWLQFHVPMMKEFAKRRRRRGLPTTVIDADSSLETEFGII